jgi:hypothetical protein
VKVARIEIYGIMASRCFMVQGAANDATFYEQRLYTAELLCEEAYIIFPFFSPPWH